MGEPLPICYLNGEYLPLREARISPLDRGFLYSDGAYEVTPVYGGRPFRFQQHHDRLTRSLTEIRMDDPLTRDAWRSVYRELIARNGAARSLYICAGDARRRVRPQPRAAARRTAHGVRLRRTLAGRPRRLARDRPARGHRGGHALGALRHQVGVAARERAAAPARGRRKRQRDASCCATASSPIPAPRACTWCIDGELRTPPNSWKLLPGHDARRHRRSRGEGRREMARRGRVRSRTAFGQRNPAGSGDARSTAGDLARRQAGRNGKPGPVWRKLYDAYQGYKREIAGTPW